MTLSRAVRWPGVRLSTAGYSIALSGFVASLGWWLAQHVARGQWDYDEGIYLMWTQLWRAGYPLYSAVWIDQPPAFVVSLRLVFDAFGPSLAVARLVPIGCALLGLVGVAWMVRELRGGRLASLFAAAVLFIVPDFFWLSRALIADLPSMSLATLALASAVRYLRLGRRAWLIASGILFALALSIKLIAAPVLLPLGLTIVLRHWGRRNWLQGSVRDGLLLIASLVLTFAPTLVLWDVRGLAQQIVGTYASSREVYSWKLADQFWTAIWPFLVNNLGLMAMALFGLWSVARLEWRLGLVAATWLGVILLALWTHVPLWPSHHMVVLLFPTSVLGAMALDGILSSRLKGYPRVIWILIGCAALGLYVASLPETLHVDQARIGAPEVWEIEDMAKVAHDLTKPGDFVMTDLPMIAFLAGRLVPPSLVDTSEKRIASGYLAGHELVAAGETYQPQVIVSWRGELVSFPEFRHWMKQHYRRVMDVGSKRRLFVRFESAK